ncbi:MAG: hypothetical protein FWG67_08525 [Defluviitaleaceae bacterium]|nr:hypothetical protein [Defluviitaleaceae bacterium]
MLKKFSLFFTALLFAILFSSCSEQIHDDAIYDLVSIEVIFDGEYIVETIENNHANDVHLSHPILEQKVDNEWVLIPAYLWFDFEDEGVMVSPNEIRHFKSSVPTLENPSNGYFRYSRQVRIGDSDDINYLRDEFSIPLN